jgi:Flp pilus assembly protein TadD
VTFLPRSVLKLDDIYLTALDHHGAGRLEEAKAHYIQVLAEDSRHAGSLHLLGVIFHQAGHLAPAIQLIREAISIEPLAAPFYFSLASVLKDAGDLAGAAENYRQTLAIWPQSAEAHNNLANLLREQGDLAQAVHHATQAVEFAPLMPEAHSSLGAALHQQGHLEEAAACFQRAMAADPTYAEAYYNLAAALEAMERPAEAVEYCRRAIALAPNAPQAHNNLGVALKTMGALEEAAICFQRVIELQPDCAEAHNNLGTVLHVQGRLGSAESSLRRALALTPGSAEAHINLGSLLEEIGQRDEAENCFRPALALNPDLPEAHLHLAMALLARGDFAAGWRDYEWRFKTRQMAPQRRHFAVPQWQGEAGRTVLIHAEQGYGDTLQFCRFVAPAAALGVRVIMEVPKALFRLLRDLPGPAQVISKGEPLPAHDVHLPMLSLPFVLGTTLETIPAEMPYLHAKPAEIARWQKRTAGMGRRVGLVWAGNPRHSSPAQAAVDRRRSIDPARLAPLFTVAGVQFISLQKDGPLVPAGFPVLDCMAEVEDFADTAALIATLDLVISVDTAVAHLAAALGKPVWLLNRFDSCWRWLTGRRDSPWYPGLRLYNQPVPGDWESVLAEVANDLSKKLKT